ncbi:MAG: phenylalanine--tRNA ligase subunit beta [Candidatus Saganbacteria bacterium]|nr:phenylalanine--tRNA ligase subunit beta [Candidatus Saganbacteria bacterium]
MKIPFEWLKEFVDADGGIEKVAQGLSMSGTEIASKENNVLEIEILPNRGDCLSVLGVAREVCAVQGKNLKSQKAEVKEEGRQIGELARVEVKDKKLCPRYMARVITDITIGDSPSWMQKRLLDCGMRPINNIVDITNYVLLESGQPLHAFDLDRLEGKKIIVRKAADKEKIKTLDDVERTLSKDDLVIADENRPVAIAGVMGGGSTEVSSSTKNILLESAYFEPASVNRTAKDQKMRTEASIRFERGVDFDNVAKALDRAAGLMTEHGKGKAAKGVIDIKESERKPKEIILRPEKLNKVLGIEVPEKKCADILTGLGFSVGKSGESLKVAVPLHRAGDIEREIDLIEEVARIFGYDKLKETVPSIEPAIKSDDRTEKSIRKESRLKQVLADCGFSEAKTFSMTGEKLYSKAGLTLGKAVPITNPLIDEMTHLRTTIVPGLLEAAQYNIHRQMHDIALFEAGSVFSLQGSEQRERTVVSALLTGSVWEGAVEKDPSASSGQGKISEDLYYLKGIVEDILDLYGEGKAEFRTSSGPLLKEGAEIFLNGDKIGFFGQVQDRIKANFDLTAPVFIFEIDLDALCLTKEPLVVYSSAPKFPSVRRDIAMFIPENVLHKDIAGLIRSAGGRLVESVTLFDKFESKGRISLAYSVIYRDVNKTLTDEAVNTVHGKVINALVEKLNVEIRK